MPLGVRIPHIHYKTDSLPGRLDIGSLSALQQFALNSMAGVRIKSSSEEDASQFECALEIQACLAGNLHAIPSDCAPHISTDIHRGHSVVARTASAYPAA